MAPSPREIELHNSLFEQAVKLLDGELWLDGAPRSKTPPTSELRDRLQSARSSLERVLAINAANTSAMFLLGKIHQRMREPEAAARHFLQAHNVERGNTNFLTDTANELLEVGRATEAVACLEKAITLQPKDSSLLSNLAIAFLVAGKPALAREKAEAAKALNPKDRLPELVFVILDLVRQGKAPLPRSTRDIYG